MREHDAEQVWLGLDPADDTDAMPHILASSMSYRIAVGTQQSRKAIPLGWNGEEMHMVWHQAVCPEVETGIVCELF